VERSPARADLVPTGLDYDAALTALSWSPRRLS
jgi:hypothetical protein